MGMSDSLLAVAVVVVEPGYGRGRRRPEVRERYYLTKPIRLLCRRLSSMPPLQKLKI